MTQLRDISLQARVFCRSINGTRQVACEIRSTRVSACRSHIADSSSATCRGAGARQSPFGSGAKQEWIRSLRRKAIGAVGRLHCLPSEVLPSSIEAICVPLRSSDGPRASQCRASPKALHCDLSAVVRPQFGHILDCITRQTQIPRGDNSNVLTLLKASSAELIEAWCFADRTIWKLPSPRSWS